MANPLQIILGGSAAHQQREGAVAEAAAQSGMPQAPPAQAAPASSPIQGPSGAGKQSFLSQAAVAPQQQNTSTKTLLGS